MQIWSPWYVPSLWKRKQKKVYPVCRLHMIMNVDYPLARGVECRLTKLVIVQFYNSSTRKTKCLRIVWIFVDTKTKDKKALCKKWFLFFECSISSYVCMREVERARKKRKSCFFFKASPRLYVYIYIYNITPGPLFLYFNFQCQPFHIQSYLPGKN